MAALTRLTQGRIRIQMHLLPWSEAPTEVGDPSQTVAARSRATGRLFQLSMPNREFTFHGGVSGYVSYPRFL